jgi:hypothetical protein
MTHNTERPAMNWEVTISYLKNFPTHFNATDTDDLEKQIVAFADKHLKRPHVIEFDGFTDEHRAYLVRGKRRRIFINVQAVG